MDSCPTCRRWPSICTPSRNSASDGFVFADPLNIGKFSAPGCIIASPSYLQNLGGVDQDYVFNWTRDAAIAPIELAFALMPTGSEESRQSLTDDVNFANICQKSGAPTIGHACFTIERQPRPWSEESDRSALQTLAILQAWPKLDTPTQTTARTVIEN